MKDHLAGEATNEACTGDEVDDAEKMMLRDFCLQVSMAEDDGSGLPDRVVVSISPDDTVVRAPEYGLEGRALVWNFYKDEELRSSADLVIVPDLPSEQHLQEQIGRLFWYALKVEVNCNWERAICPLGNARRSYWPHGQGMIAR